MNTFKRWLMVALNAALYVLLAVVVYAWVILFLSLGSYEGSYGM